MRAFIVSVVVYIAYAAYATFTDNEWMNIAAGVILIIGLLIMNRKVVSALWGYLTDMIKSFSEKRKKGE